jgi:hypothetical protein
MILRKWNRYAGNAPIWWKRTPGGVLARNEFFGADVSATVTLGVGAVTVVGFAPTVDVGGAVDFTATPGAGAVTVTGLAPTLAAGATAAPGAGAVTVAGQAPTLAAGASMAPGAGAVTALGRQPTVAANSTAAPGVGAVTVTGFAPTVDVAGNVTLTPGVGVVTVAGLAPVVAANSTTAPGTGTVTVVGFAPTVQVGGSVSVETGLGLVVFTGLAPQVSAANEATGPVQGGWGFQDLDQADRVARKTDEDRKRTREERKAAVLRAFDALDPKPVPVPTAATVERIAVRALDDLGIDRAAAELRRIEAMVRDLWQQRLAEIAREQEDEAIALLLLAA